MATKTERRTAISNRAKAMSHPLRRAALLHMQEHGVCSPVEIAHALGADTSDVSYHIKRLEALGCAELVRVEMVRGAVKHFYCNTERHLIDTGEWKDLDPAVRDGLLADFFQPAVDDFTCAVNADIFERDERWHVTRSPLLGMDQQGLDEALAIQERAFREILELPARCAERMAETGEEPIAVSSSQFCFEVPGF